MGKEKSDRLSTFVRRSHSYAHSFKKETTMNIKERALKEIKDLIENYWYRADYGLGQYSEKIIKLIEKEKIKEIKKLTYRSCPVKTAILDVAKEWAKKHEKYLIIQKELLKDDELLEKVHLLVEEHKKDRRLRNITEAIKTMVEVYAICNNNPKEII